MKKKILSFILIIVAMICAFGLYPNVVLAEAPSLPDESALGRKITTEQILDTQLYYSLLEVYNKYYELPRKVDETTTIPRMQVVYKNMFAGMDFGATDGVLNLGGGINSKNGISDLTGLELLDFSGASNLTAVNLSHNSLSSISASSFSSLASIVTSIDLSNNLISTCDLSSLTKLNNINLSNNYISSINMSFLRTEDSDVIVNINSNPIKDVNNITLRRQELLVNNIVVVGVNTFESATYNGNNKVKVVSGVVGLNTSNKYMLSTGLKYNKIDDLSLLGLTASDIKIVIKDSTTFETVKTISNSSVVGEQNILQGLNCGNYLLYFTDGDDNSIKSICDVFVDRYSAHEIKVVPTTPTMTITVDGEEVELASEIKLSKNGKAVFSTPDPDAVIYYRLNNGEWVEGCEIDINADVATGIVVKAVKGDYVSDVISVYILSNHTFGLKEILLIAVIVIMFLALIFGLMPLVRYFINRPLVVNKPKDKDNKPIDNN